MDPTKDKIDTRGNAEQRASLLSAMEIAHGARMEALRELDLALGDERSPKRRGRTMVDYDPAWTADVPERSGFYWCIDRGHPHPEVFYLHYAPGGWCLYGAGGFSHGLSWSEHWMRTREPLERPAIFAKGAPHAPA